MLNFFRDPIWQFVGVLIAVGGIFFSWYTTFRPRKRMAYQVLAQTPLVSVEPDVKDKFQFIYDGQPVIEPYLLLVKITNNGNVPITNSDFVNPISIVFDGQTKIIKAEIIESAPQNLHPTLLIPPAISDKKTRVVLEPTLWNHDDYIVVKLILSGFYNREIKVDTRIIGVQEIRKSDAIPSKGLSHPGVRFGIFWVVTYIIFMVWGVIFGGLFGTNDILFTFSASVASMVVVFISTWYWYWFYKSQQ